MSVSLINSGDTKDNVSGIKFQSSGLGANSYSLTLNAPTAVTANRTISMPDPGANCSLLLSEGDKTINGDCTFGSRIIGPGFIHNGVVALAPFAAGSALSAVPAGDRTINSAAGKLSYTGIATILSGATDVLTIVNNQAGNTGIVSLEVGATANDSVPLISSVVWNFGVSIVVTIKNYSATATGANGAFNFTFMSFD